MIGGPRFLYFLLPIDGPGRVKIGISINVEARLACLMRQTPYQLKIAAKVLGTKADEYFVHWNFRDAHVHSEWFNLTPDVQKAVDFIAKYGVLPSLLNRKLVPKTVNLACKKWTGDRWKIARDARVTA